MSVALAEDAVLAKCAVCGLGDLRSHVNWHDDSSFVTWAWRLFDDLKPFWVPGARLCTPTEGELPQQLPHPQHSNSRMCAASTARIYIGGHHVLPAAILPALPQ